MLFRSASAYTNTEFEAVYFPEYKSAMVTEIAGVRAPKTGYWALFVNGSPAQLGAADVILKPTDSVVWIADTDYSAKNGPFVYDLASKDNGNGTVTFTGIRIGGTRPKPAAGVAITVNGTAVTLDAKGKATIAIAHPWTASIGARGNVLASETLTG